MNKRQRKKVEDKLLIRLRKLHPSKGDFIFVEFDPDKIDIDIVLKYFDAISNAFNNIANFAMVPDGITIKNMNRDRILKYIEKLKELIENER
jgi:hypothetical protein|nr:MAG TPA: hypothetical protein [Caudoviricetes sp.]